MYNASVTPSSSILSGLNPPQREAVETTSGPVLIIAGPGSGKTRVITHRIAYLVDHCDVSPSRIAALTFTNKAAREMKSRMNALLQARCEQVTVSTFHAFCAMVLRRDGTALDIKNDFTIYDSIDQISALKKALQEANVDLKQFSPSMMHTAISAAKSQLISVEGYGLGKSTYIEEIVHRVYERYEEILNQANALDFDDLLLKTHDLFDKFPHVVEIYHQRYTHLMVDEFQDTNTIQYAITKQLSGKHRNLCVVGDPDQSIYAWRNADVHNILNFKTDFPDAKLIALEQNYRSTETILEAAQGVIAPNEQRVEKELWTDNSHGTQIVLTEQYNEQEEAQFTIREAKRLTREKEYDLRDIAVMYRLNAQSRALEEACVRQGIPYQLVGSLRFYQRQEVKDVLAYLRVIVNPNDDVSFQRIVNTPTRGIGQRTIHELTRYARDNTVSLFDAIDHATVTNGHPDNLPLPLPTRSLNALSNFKKMIVGFINNRENLDLTTLIDKITEETGYKEYLLGDPDRGEERWENLLELRNTAKNFEDSGGQGALNAFLESVSLVTDTDNMTEEADAITLITLHQAKGLEYPVVFIVGMEDGLLPHSRSIETGDPTDLEEERRLFYVGITRAKEQLYLLRAFRRGFRGRSEPNLPSRFLTDIPQRLVTKPEPNKRDRTRKANLISSNYERKRGRGSQEREIGNPDLIPTARSENIQKPVTRRLRQSEASPPNQASKPKLNTGDHVRHKTFGEGVVTGTKPSHGDLEVTVAFRDGHGVKRLMLGFAPLEKLK